MKERAQKLGYTMPAAVVATPEGGELWFDLGGPAARAPKCANEYFMLVEVIKMAIDLAQGRVP
jgi:hypothetical protein